MEQVKNDWNALKDEQEVEIIKKYTQSGRKHLYAFAGRKSDRNTQIIWNRKIVSINDLLTFVI